MSLRSLLRTCILLLVSKLSAQTIALEPVAVTATRFAQPASAVPFSLVRLDAGALRAVPASTLDGVLRSVPAFSLFRRSDSFSSNPTAQGVSLRGLGPSGASRSLVLFDGIPLNDPFGGWVAWTKLPRESLGGVELVTGGGATAWGNAALGGVVQLFSAPADHKGRVAATVGDFGTRSLELTVTQPAGAATLQISGRDFATDGFTLVSLRNRGPVDIDAWSQHRWLSTRWSQPIGEGVMLTVVGRAYAEKRGNGTDYQRNSSRENFGSIRLEAKSSASFNWTVLAYGQDQEFGSTFSSVNVTRTTETPASDQFAVPAEALGLAWTGSWTGEGGTHTSAGVDWRRVRGETRENYMFSNGDFIRQRIAGGVQDFTGLFVLHQRPLASGLRAMLGARADEWNETAGHRREFDRQTGGVLRDDRYASRKGMEFSPSAGLVWTPAAEWRLRATIQRAFRRPTLNELYRPFRVGNVVTEANADLATERTTSAEIGAEYAIPRLTLGAAVFWNELDDAVGNVTLYRGPGTFPVVGFIPAGGAGRQRLNLDRLKVQGVELRAQWHLGTSLSIDAAWLCNDSQVRRAAVAPGLVGKRLAQVPTQSAMLGAEWRIGPVKLSPRFRVLGRQFEDDENLLPLASTVVTDLGLRYSLKSGGEWFLTVENLGNTQIETGRSADGLVTTGTPRFTCAGLRWAW